MIELRGVSYVYPTATRPTLNDVDLAVREGEWLLLAGPSGCGKSTLLYLLNGLIPHVLAGDLRGEVHVDGISPGQIPLAEVSRRVGTVFQNPEVQLFMLRVAEDVAFGCENLGLPPAETLRRVELALTQLSLESLRDHEVFRLSGGQKQRLAIAGALAMGCRTLLLDEPTSDLDTASRSELLAALRELHRGGHTIVMTEHRLDGLQGLVDRVITLDGGRDRYGRTVSEDPGVVRVAQAPVPGGEAIVEAEQLAFAYPGHAPVLRDVSFRLHAGEVVGLTGCNGVGKTTLLKLLCGLLRPSHGRLTIAGREQPSLRDTGRRSRPAVPESRRATLHGKRGGGGRIRAGRTSAARWRRSAPRTNRLVPAPRRSSAQPVARAETAAGGCRRVGDEAAADPAGRTDHGPGSAGLDRVDADGRGAGPRRRSLCAVLDASRRGAGGVCQPATAAFGREADR